MSDVEQVKRGFEKHAKSTDTPTIEEAGDVVSGYCSRCLVSQEDGSE